MTTTLRLWIIGGLVGSLLGMLLLAAGASRAHTLNADGNWYFDGSLYDDDEISDGSRKDPINLIFAGGGGTSHSTECRFTSRTTGAHTATWTTT